MKPYTAVKNGLNRALAPTGVQVISRFELDCLRGKVAKFFPASGLAISSAVLPQGAVDYLRPDNPRLIELRLRYRELDRPAVKHSIWTDRHTSMIDLPFFRADNPYLWQENDQNAEINYILTALYLKSIDKLGLFDSLREDGLFGVQTFRLDENMLLTRDLLDSVSEITFLEETLGISKIRDLTILDIGAGYGRFAYRLCAGLPALQKVVCVDAVAESTFLSEYYLRFRGVTEKAEVTPLYEIEAALERNDFRLAVNMHSFSECNLDSICWWLDLVSAHGIPYLFIVPNAQDHGGTKLLTLEAGGAKSLDFMEAILSRGYRLTAKRAKYAVPTVQKYGVSPTYYYLFELHK